MITIPNEIINKIYEFDGRYNISYKNIINQLNINIFEYNRNTILKKNTIIFNENIDLLNLIESDYFYDNDFYKYMLKMINNKKIL